MKRIITFFGIGMFAIALAASCNNSDSNGEETINAETAESADVAINYLEEGKKMAQQAQGVLGKNLTTAIEEGGTIHALEFCNTRAIPLTDSMSQLLHASLKRVTDKTRNPDNKANVDELKHIEYLKNEVAEGREPGAKIVEIDGKMVGYYPIVTNGLCVQCHGDKSNVIEPETLKRITALYPADEATGYAINEIRGMWVVEMDKQE